MSGNGGSPRATGRSAGVRGGIGAVVAVALVLAAAPLAGATTNESALKRIERAARSTLSEGSAHETMTESLVLNGQSSEILSMQGVADFSGEASFSATGISGDSGSPTAYDVVESGTAEYLKFDHQAGAIAAGQWYEVSQQKAGASIGISTGSSGGFTNGSPTQLLTLLQAEGAAVQVVGSATVGGVPTVEFHADVNLAKATAWQIAHGETHADAQGLQALETIIGGGDVPVNVWIDNQSRIRKYQLDVPFSRAELKKEDVGSSVRSLTIAVTVVLSQYGPAVAIPLPPASEVEPLPSGGTNPE